MRKGLPLRRRQMGMHQYQMKVEIHHQIHQSLGSPEKSHSTLKFTNHTWFNSILDTCFPITDGTIWIWEFASIFGRYCHTLDTSNCFYILLSAFRQCLQLQWFQLFSGTQVWFWRQEFWFWTADGTLPSLFQQKHPKKCYQHAYLKWSITVWDYKIAHSVFSK